MLVEPGNVVDAEAQAAVNALDSTALEQLDAEVASRVQRLLGESMGANALRSPATLAQWRPIVWRALQDGKERQA